MRYITQLNWTYQIQLDTIPEYWPVVEALNQTNLGIISSNWLPDPKIIKTSINKILEAFGDKVQTELVRVRWEEIKRLQIQPIATS